MADTQLLQSFRACQRYKNAKSWQKPLINPRRFLVNQLRSQGFFRCTKGELRTVDVFHQSGFTIVAGELVSREIESYGIIEESLTEAFLRLIKPGYVVVDIGMHLGYYTTLFARLVTETGEVHAFEPTPSTRDMASRNVTRFPQVFVHPQAVWSCVQSLSFRDYGLECMGFNSFTKAKVNSAPPARILSVETTTLDKFRASLARPITLVKIDAESAEQEILRGATDLMQTDRPFVSLEVGDCEGLPTSRGALNYIKEFDYEAWELKESRFSRHSPQDTYTYDNLILAPSKIDLSSV